MSNPPESELETIVQYLCTQSIDYKVTDIDNFTPYRHGSLYWFNEEQYVSPAFFQMVVNEQDEPITKLVRKA